MKYYLYSILFLLPFSINSQIYEAKQLDSYSTIVKHLQDSTSSDIFKITEFDLDSLIKLNKQSKLHLIYVYAYWCKPCVEKFPSIIELSKELKIPLYIINEEVNNSKKMFQTKNNLSNKFNLNIPSFSYNFGEFENESFKKRTKYFQRFFKYYLKECYERDFTYGYSSFFVLDENAKLVFTKGSANTDEGFTKKISELKNIIKQRHLGLKVVDFCNDN